MFSAAVLATGAIVANRYDIAVALVVAACLLLVVHVALALVAYLALRIVALGGLMRSGSERVHLGLHDGVATAVALFGEYAKWLIAPVRLTPVRDFHVASSLLDPRVLLGAAALAVLAIVLWVGRRHRGVLLGGAFLLLPLLPALYVPLLGDNAGSERYAYLRSVGAALLLAAGIEVLRERWSRAGAAIAAAAVLLVLATRAMLSANAVWRDELTLWSHAVEQSPGSAPAHESLGQALIAADRPAEAIPIFVRALEIDGSRREVHVNLASALAAAGRPAEALSEASIGVRLLPNVAEAHAVLGSALAAERRFGEAAQAYERALSLNRSLAPIHNAAAFAYAQLGRVDLALQHVREAVRLEPGNPLYAGNLAALSH